MGWDPAWPGAPGRACSSEQTTNLSWQRQVVRPGVWWDKGLYESLRIQEVALGRHQLQLTPQDAQPCFALFPFPVALSWVPLLITQPWTLPLWAPVSPHFLIIFLLFLDFLKLLAVS